MAAAPTLQAVRVVAIDRETADTVTVRFTTTPPLQHRAGQYLLAEFRLGAGRWRRAYSLSSLPGEALHAITVRARPGGRISNHVVQRLAVGDSFRVSAARGDFVLPDSRGGRCFVFVAGGVGIAPVLPMLRTLLAMPQPPPVALLYYVRQEADRAFAGELAALAAAHPAFRWLPVVTGPVPAPGCLHEAFDPARVLAATPAPAATLFYVCGPDSLNRACRDALLAAGIAPARVLVEDFAATPAAEAAGAGYPVTFVRRTLLGPRLARVRTRPGETLLAAAERAGLALPSDCRRGTCGRCRVQVLRGELAMDEPNSLSPADVAAGRALACVARPATPAIIAWRR